MEDFVGHLTSSDFLIITRQAQAPMLRDRIRKRLEQSFDYFYSDQDREQGTFRDNHLGVQISDLVLSALQQHDLSHLKAELGTVLPLGNHCVKITIIVPTYNEAENLPRLVSAFFALPVPDLNLLIVDDNSPDGTGQMADDLCRQIHGRMDVLHRPGKMGLGTAYITGFKYAVEHGAEAVGQMDADFSHPVEKIVELVR